MYVLVDFNMLEMTEAASMFRTVMPSMRSRISRLREYSHSAQSQSSYTFGEANVPLTLSYVTAAMAAKQGQTQTPFDDPSRRFRKAKLLTLHACDVKCRNPCSPF